MLKFQDISIRNKLVLVIVFTSIIVIGIGFSIMTIFENQTYKKDMIENTMINAKLIGEYCIVPLTFGDKKTANALLKNISVIPYIITVCIYDDQNKLFVSYTKIPEDLLPNTIPKSETAKYTKRHYELFYPVNYSEMRVGTIYIKTSTALLEEKIRKHLLNVLLLIPGLLFLTYLIALKLQNTISKPLLDLTKTTQLITQEANYTIRVQKSGLDEIGLLYNSFNEMMRQINIREQERNTAENLLRLSENEIKKINQELEQHVKRRTSQLEAANKELEAFTYSIAHDLRSPLRAIDGFCQILIEEYSDKSNKTAFDYLGRVRSAAQHMAGLIDDLLNLSHVNLGEMKFTQANLSQIAINAINTLQESEPERNAKFTIQTELEVFGDAQLLRIAMVNLLENAWKFTSKNTDTSIEFGLKVQDGLNVFYVRDNGIGFDMEYIDKLFKPFHRLHKTVDFPGNGIGLATVQRIINRHGGKIWAEGEVDKGASFYFTLQ